MNVPIEVWYALAGAGLALLVSAAHSRGYRLPILEAILDVIQPKPAGKPPVTLEHILEELQKRNPQV